jgi:hypothetical protein
MDEQQARPRAFLRGIPAQDSGERGARIGVRQIAGGYLRVSMREAGIHAREISRQFR